ncbi:ATP-binding protein [Polaribacter glomeratus]|uniref:histidine kinase n=1 Tax=Polaribacter glomeratus TaxID=102 RepID=A0A2S7WZP2_9FLAO|nr:ATP-binding protein [Polaribacter glomeratus]PQJ82996.1 two-component system sensor histidine kinase/response regulator [Polaribacter glomeratus]TXD66943.1 response regulator [Polaribacter glomeratus]
MIFALSLIAIIVSVVCTLIVIKLNVTDLIYVHTTCIFLYLTSAYLAKKGNLKIARLLYFIILNTGIVSTASYIGQDGGVEFMLMFTMSLPFMVFSFRNEKYLIAIFSLTSIFLWIALYVTDFNLITTSKIAIETASNLIYPVSIITTLFLVTFQLMYFSYLNYNSSYTIHSSREDALEASEAKSKFLSTMSHEIRTPLNAVIGLSHILGDNKPREDQIQNIEALNYSGKILLNLLNNVLDFSKMQSTKIELDAIPTDISAAIKQIKKIHESSCNQKGISMNLEIDDAIPVVYLDIVRYNQVINNLVTNAIKFTDEGSVTLKIKKQKETINSINILTEVIDTGIGIPKDKQDTIWEAFTQASTTTNRLYGGTGLGLPIVKSIVEAMNSKVKIESMHGTGSRFYFNLDLKLASNTSLNKSNQKKERNFDGKKVLLVEDNLINVMVGKQILEKAKLNVDVVNDGLAAVNKVKENTYDIVLMDIQMPIMDGYQATIEIRKFNKTLPILALSASIFMEVKDKINESGMNGFIYKPFNPEDLLDKIEQAISN